jgi:hypothetical protein
MALLSIGTRVVHQWDGPPPRLAHAQVEPLAKPGLAGHSAINTGVRGEQFEVVTTTFFSSQANAQTELNTYRTGVGGNPVKVEYNGKDYDTENTRFLLLSVVTEKFCPVVAFQYPALGINLQPAYCLSVRWRMLAVPYTP